MSAHVELKNFSGKIANWQGDAVILLLREGEPAPECPAGASGIAQELIDRHDFTGKRNMISRVPLFDGHVRNLYLVGLGSKDGDPAPATGKKISGGESEAVRSVLTASLRKIGREHNESALLLIGNRVLTDDELSISEILGEAVGLCGYDFDKYKSKAETDNAGELSFTLKTIWVPGLNETDAKRGELYAAAQIHARDLENEPGCAINPAIMSEIAQSVAAKVGLECEVWDQERLKSERMGAVLAVGSGSKTPPRLVHLTWRPANASKKIALVGKGITFDSGGINLKPAKWLRTMKGDKSGASIMLSVIRAVAELKLPIEVHAILPLAENMPSGSAYRPDDIIRGRNGKTIEVDDTDAEGRILLSDALALASELQPDAIIDIATLTGACAVGLGLWRAGLISNDDTLANALLASSRRRGEELWRLPAWDALLADELKSPVADLINVSSVRMGDAIFAAIFLSEFVGKKISWAHIDIAGCDFTKKAWGVYTEGESGFGVRLILDCIAALAGVK